LGQLGLPKPSPVSAILLFLFFGAGSSSACTGWAAGHWLSAEGSTRETLHARSAQ